MERHACGANGLVARDNILRRFGMRRRQPSVRRPKDGASEPKISWVVDGAQHQDALRFDAVGFEGHVVGFLNGYQLAHSGGGHARSRFRKRRAHRGLPPGANEECSGIVIATKIRTAHSRML